MPFTITIHGIGTLHRYQNSNNQLDKECFPTDYGTVPSSSDLGFTVDTSESYWEFLGDSNLTLKYSLNGDILQFFLSYHDTLGGVPDSDAISSSITFAHGEDSIISIVYYENETYFQTPALPAMPEINKQYAFQCFSLLFNDSSIFTTDSSFSRHKISATDFETEIFTYQYSSDVCYEHSDFTSSSVNLSGIFRPTHFADPSSVVEEVAPPLEALSVTSMNGGLRCSFGASDEERLLEIYSPLGIRTASCSVSPGQSQAVIPRITPGFYFVRLGNSLAKVFVAE